MPNFRSIGPSKQKLQRGALPPAIPICKKPGLLRLHDAIYRLRFYPNALIYILSVSNVHSNVASIQKNWGNNSLHVFIALGPCYIDSLHWYVFKSLHFQIDPLWIVYSNVLPFHDRFHRFRVNRTWNRSIYKWKRIPVIGALGPVTISLRFHFLFTGNDEDNYENANIWTRKPNWIYLKTQGYKNRRIWKCIHLTGP